MVEYALIVALVVGIAIVAFNSGLKNSVTSAFGHASTAIESVSQGN